MYMEQSFKDSMTGRHKSANKKVALRLIYNDLLDQSW